MKLKVTTPCQAFVEEATEEELDKLRKQLSYTNTSAQHQVRRLYNNHWARRKDEAAWENQLEKLKKTVHNTLIFEEDGKKYIRPGSIPYLKGFELQVENTIVYPKPKKVPWEKPLPFQLHPYQETSAEKLPEASQPSNVELCTGAGKSAILLKVCRETGFRAAIVAPSKSIFLELLEKFEYHFGKKMVGRFGDGKKVLGKRFTICIGDSIANIQPGTEEWTFFSGLEMLCVDESHTWGAETLKEICHGVLSNIPVRMFFSGTQTRGDGSEKLLQSIIGKTVYTLTTKEAVAGGYICPHDYRIVEIESSNPNYMTADALDMKRVHFLSNKNICAFIAKLAIAEARTHRRQTLVLVEELSQISALLPILQSAGIPTAIAHSEKKPERLSQLAIAKVDNQESVEKFNKGEALVLIGTSCISTGTNIYPTHNTCNWQGGASEIKTKQGAVGRSVRLGSQNPYEARCTPKTKSLIWDFRVYDIHLMDVHTDDRIGYYKDSGSEIKAIRLKK